MIHNITGKAYRIRFEISGYKINVPPMNFPIPLVVMNRFIIYKLGYFSQHWSKAKLIF